MIKLQNNFTTPEQSKRLLELGLPADSADCYHTFEKDEFVATDLIPLNHHYKKYCETSGVYQRHFVPCWSVGRLIEIAIICNTGASGILHLAFNNQLDNSKPLVEQIIENLADVEFNWSDFSKLEE